VEGKNISTYATVAPETGEETVKSLYLLFFQPSNNNTGTFIEAIEVTGTLSMNTTISITIPAGSALSTSGAYNVLAVANLTENKYLDGTNINAWLAQLAGKTEKQVMEQSIARNIVIPNGKIAPDELLMQGHTSKAANTGNISLVLTRNLVRFDVSNNQKQTHDLVSTSIWNAYPQSSIFGKGLLDYSSAVARLKRFYGIDDNKDAGGLYPDIKGGLYAFENEVVAPADNDKLTTCLIIGLRDHTTTNITYYRVNIRPQSSAQVLKRNNVYRVTITDVFGPGAKTEDEAYSGIGTQLGYTINYWDLDDNGLIVQDGVNILAIPTKTIRIGAEGGDFTYSIYTFSASGTPAAPLQIKSQTWNPQTNDIQASLIGNTLLVKAQKMATGSPDRNGVIILSYAGLEASISVLQSSSVSTYLEALLPGGAIPPFGASPGIYSGEIEIRASGAWTAELFGDDGFSFGSNTDPLVRKIVYDPGNTISDEIRADKYFKIWTYTLNNISRQRKAFIVVSLDSDPVNYVRVITLTQNPQGGVNVTPNPVNFSVTDYSTPQTASVAAATTAGETGWTATLSGTNADKFNLSRLEGDGVSSGQTSFDVSTVEQNLSGAPYTATIRVALKKEPQTYQDITVTQQPVHFTVSQTTFPVMSHKGDSTPSISIDSDPAFHWSATVSMSSATATDGRVLMNHEAYLTDENGARITGIQSVTTPFRVKLPKVYWPNREIQDIEATVTLTLHDANRAVIPLTQILSVSQNSLDSVKAVAANMRISASPAYGPTDYGALLCTGFELNYKKTLTKYFQVQNGLPNEKTTYLHAFAIDVTNNVSHWKPINRYICDTNNEGVTVLSMEVGSGFIDNLNLSGTTLDSLGYKMVVSDLDGNVQERGILNIASKSTRIYQLLVTEGKNSVPETTTFYKDVFASEATNLPATAVSIIRRNNNNTNTILSIDPTTRVIYIGDLQAVGTDIGWTTDRQKFLDNLTLYIVNTARYGSHFSDMFIDNSSVPSPWDNVWKDNCKEIIKPTP
jgi:hypothetical protein